MRLATMLALAAFGSALPVLGGEALRRKVLIISLDGCRPDALQAASTPNVDALIADGAHSYLAQTGPVPISGPAYSSMFTGVWNEKHGVWDNEFTGSRFDLYPIFFCRLKAWRPEIVTQSIVRWQPLDPNLISCADVHLAPGSDASATTEAVRLLSQTDPDVLFYHLEDIDGAGHTYTFSPTAEGYLAAIEKSDARVGEVFQALRGRPTYPQEDWLIITISDHGGSAKDHHADTPENRTIFMIASGRLAARGEIQPPPVIVDVAVTAMAYLGLDADPSWGLDGVPFGLATGPLSSLLLPSDCNQDGDLTISDVVCLLGLLFKGEVPVLPCGGRTLEGGNVALLDSNGDLDVDVSDAVFVILHLFGGGPPPTLGTSCVPLDGCLGVCPSSS